MTDEFQQTGAYQNRILNLKTDTETLKMSK